MFQGCHIQKHAVGFSLILELLPPSLAGMIHYIATQIHFEARYFRGISLDYFYRQHCIFDSTDVSCKLMPASLFSTKVLKRLSGRLRHCVKGHRFQSLLQSLKASMSVFLVLGIFSMTGMYYRRLIREQTVL